MKISRARTVAVLGGLALVVAWPVVDSAKAKWNADQARKDAEMRERIQAYKEMRADLGMSSLPPADMLAKHDADARRLKNASGGHGRLFEGAASALGPTYMEFEAEAQGRQPCQRMVRDFAGGGRDVRIFVNGRTLHRKDAWTLCHTGANSIRVIRG